MPGIWECLNCPKFPEEPSYVTERKIVNIHEVSIQKKILERFFWYVKTDTQSQEDVQDRYPSTEKQKVLSMLLLDELCELGIKDAQMDDYGIVTATCPGNLPKDQAAKVPVIGFLAHVDTSPEVSGSQVMPILHHNYHGKDITLPGDKTQIIRVTDNPELKKYIGRDIVTSDGTTLLGADDKAGLTEIMTLIEYLKANPDIQHGTIRVAFTPDEEVGRGTEHFNVEMFGADFAYTVDGGRVGEIENESFNASTAIFTIQGVNYHPGYAKGKMVNAIRIVSDIIQELKNDPSPESTEKREGYLHPYVNQGSVEKSILKILLRDFDMRGIDEKRKRLQSVRNQINRKYPNAKIDLEIMESYKNMRLKLDQDPRVVEYALEAAKRAGLDPRLQFIRGGTDGARLCDQGLLTPNIFTGGMNFHSKLEWIPVEAMELAVRTLVHLVQIWAEESLGKK